jgi:DNA (cytosine-5)-methyltransferase 1
MTRDPFKMIVACSLVNQTTWTAARGVHATLTDRYPTPTALAASHKCDVESVIEHLGLSKQRSEQLVDLARSWVARPPRCRGDVLALPGCGRYAADSWSIFVDNDLDVVPTDRKLLGYLARARARARRPIRLLDLFSGIGGISLGLERAGGFRTVAFCEIDESCRSILARHWSEIPYYDDIRSLTAARLADDGVTVDGVCGGFPCQDISSASGAPAGIDGDRSGLWSEYSRLVGELRPRYVIVENVSALLIRGLDRVLGDLAALGYDAEWHCIPASALGADHERDRVWIVAYPGAVRHNDEVGRQEREGEVGQDAARVDAGFRDGRGSSPEGNRLSIGAAFGAALSSKGRVQGFRREGMPQPVLPGGLDGVPGGVDRVAALGNSVVPQIPELIGRAIMWVEGMTSNWEF